MKNTIKNDSFYSELRSLVIPIAIQSFMLALVSVTDAVMLGAAGQEPMAAVSQAGQIQFFLNIVISGFSTGVGIMAAQYWGKGDKKSIEEIAPVGLAIILVLAGGLSAMAFFKPEVLMAILTNDTELIRLGGGYLHDVSLSYLLCGITQVYFALLRNTGHADKSSFISSVAVVANIIFNGILIFGLLGMPALGIRGAAYATVIARALELVLAYIVTVRKGFVQLYWSGMFRKVEKLLLEDFVRYTSPVIGAGLVWGIASMSYNVIMGHMGGDAVAANSIVSIAKSLLSCMIRGVGAGAGILLGNLLGANQLDKAKVYGLRLTKLSAVVGAVTGGLLILITPLLVRFAPLNETSAEYLKIMGIFCGFNVCAQSINHVVLDGVFGAGGDAKFDMKGNIIFMWCCCVPLGFLSAFVLKLPAPLVYCIVNMDEIIKLPMVFHHYKKYVWLRNITRDF